MGNLKESHGKLLKLPSGSSAYAVAPDGPARGGVLVVQEIFGLNSHIRSVTDRFASQGYFALAPAYFDPIRPGVELDYDARGVATGRQLMEELGWERALSETRVAARELKRWMIEEGAERRPIATVGYCWGGSVSWLAACRLSTEIDGAVCYYGRHIIEFKSESPRVPTILHYGRKDASIPPENIAAIQASHPTLPIHVYDAGHGFNCEARQDFEAESARLALDRTLAFLKGLTT